MISNILPLLESKIDNILACNDVTSTIESEIDQLIYQLYGLTEDEIKIVEGA